MTSALAHSRVAAPSRDGPPALPLGTGLPAVAPWLPWFAWRPVTADLVLTADPAADPVAGASRMPARGLVWLRPIERRRSGGGWRYRRAMREPSQDEHDAAQW